MKERLHGGTPKVVSGLPSPSFPWFFLCQRKPQKHQGFLSPGEPLKTLENKQKTLKKLRKFAARKGPRKQNTKKKKDRVGDLGLSHWCLNCQKKLTLFCGFAADNSGHKTASTPPFFWPFFWTFLHHSPNAHASPDNFIYFLGASFLCNEVGPFSGKFRQLLGNFRQFLGNAQAIFRPLFGNFQTISGNFRQF